MHEHQKIKKNTHDSKDTNINWKENIALGYCNEVLISLDAVTSDIAFILYKVSYRSLKCIPEMPFW